jgi:hypothetical protein
MPVRKFRSIEDMDAPPPYRSGDPALFTAMRGLWEIGARTSRRRYPPGVHKHASLEEMSRVQEAWLRQSIAPQKPSGPES